jgi:hypothetical protein
MKKVERFITFDIRGMHDEDKLVNSLLNSSVEYMNKRVIGSPKLYAKMSGHEVEKFSYDSMVAVAPSVGFPINCIDLVSGYVFPDIVLHGHQYGVEIKSTQKDNWTSTGSSIVESTRSSEAKRIYMLFGKLGGFPEFRCKPYQMCLSNIAVTHSPRYLIDMNLPSEDNIFAKMNVEYDQFRQLSETDKISIVRDFYKRKAKERDCDEMPWWMGETTSVNLSFYNDLSMSQKNILQAKAFILFQSLYENDGRRRYRQVVWWLCNYYSLLCPNMRDDFSAGGRCNYINGVQLHAPYPHIVKELLLLHDTIKSLLYHPDEDLIQGIKDFWDFDYDITDLYVAWVGMVVKCFKNNPNLAHIDIKRLFEIGAIPG